MRRRKKLEFFFLNSIRISLERGAVHDPIDIINIPIKRSQMNLVSS